MTTKTLHLNGAHKKSGGRSNHFRVEIPYGCLKCETDQKIIMSVHDFMTPYTFYPVNKNNNKFTLTTAQFGTQDITIPEGFYDHETIFEYIKTVFGNILQASSSILPASGKLNLVANQSFSLSFPAVGSAERLLGFSGDKTSDSANTITGDKSVNVTPDYALFISIEHETFNLSTGKDGVTNSNVIARVPILVPPMSLIYHTGFAPHQLVFTTQNYVSFLDIRVTNERGEDLDFFDEVHMTFTFDTVGPNNGDGLVPILEQSLKHLESVDRFTQLSFAGM